MKIIDRAAWQIDGDIPEDLAINHFYRVFSWLYNHDMLTDEGIEEFEEGIDDCASLNDELINEKGMIFLEDCYDEYLKSVSNNLYGKDTDGKLLDMIYSAYKSK